MARKGANRRKYRRIPAPIHCRPAGEDFFAQRLEPVDISFGGLRTYSDEEYRVGSFLRLDIFFSGVAPVTLSTEVMWVKPLGKGAPARFELGLAFVDLKPDALNVLRRLFSEAERTEPVSEVRPVTPKAGSVRTTLGRIPVLIVGAERLRATKLDARAGFLLALIDGITSVEGMLDLSGMPAEETLDVLEDLRRRGIIALH
jgi:hypothetical protein